MRNVVPLEPGSTRLREMGNTGQRDADQGRGSISLRPHGAALGTVVAIDSTVNDGKHAAVRGWPRPGTAIRYPHRKWGSPVWAGRLVLRPAR